MTEQHPPRYIEPIPLSEALDRGADLTSIDADTVGGILAGHHLEHAFGWRAAVAAAVAGAPQPTGFDRWPTQAHVDSWSWCADLVAEPELAEALLGRLTVEQRQVVEWHLGAAERAEHAERAVATATDGEVLAAAGALAGWASAQDGLLAHLGREVGRAVDERAVDELRAFLADPDLFR